MGYTAFEDAIADFGFYLSAEAGYTLPTIERLARDEGMSDHGFVGLLEPLGDIVNGEASVMVGSAFSEMQRKLCDLGDSVLGAAKSYGYVDENNKSLLERNGLGGGTDEEIDFGHGYGNGDGYDRHLDDGSSDFKYTETDISAIDRPDTNYSEDIDTGGVLTVLDWIWSEFDVDGGKGFTDSMISPLAGNYNSIAANGEAWRSVGTNFGLLAASLGNNASTLATEYWEGDAAAAFEQFFDLFWKKGAVWAGQQLGEFVAKGFDKIADVSKRIAQLAVDCINRLITVARKIATKAIPVVGWAWTAIQSAGKWIGKIFGVDIDDLYDDIMSIINTAQAVFDLFTSMEQVVTSMQEYFNTLSELLTTVQTIPEIGSLTDAVETAETINEQRTTMDEQKTQVTEGINSADDALTELEDIAAGAENQ
ncbi:hypothetical protein [Actinophytocola gossypii]|uniref:WXG100 family type VII secretion target n=1 Tax=Actinophytocola gossypii TaxID=2812003 RepID=A0ABT2J6F6_9PSEU|nr:hypothetical protein [Actinophytocola gossypii]MCT2582849.1 hypothetical protein [Actinophytocola gossypii]